MEIHRGAGAAGDDHRELAGEDVGGEAGDLAGGGPVAGIEGRLAAAGLVVGEEDFHAEVFEHFHGGPGDVVVEGVAQAGAHQQDFFARGADLGFGSHVGQR